MRTPVTVVAGAPGSGKSTLVNRLLDGARDGVAVVEAEFGDVAVDCDLLIAAEPHPEDLARALARLGRRRVALERVFVEVADPAGALAALGDDEVAETFALERVLAADGTPLQAAATPVPASVPSPLPDAVTPEALEVAGELALGEWVCDLAWHPEGGLLAAATADGLVHEVDADAGGSALAGRHDGAASAVAYDAAGVLASGGADGRVTIATGQPRLAGAGWIEHLAWAPGGGLLATAVGRRVQLWSAAGALLAEAEPLPAAVDCLAWAPDGSRLACGGARGAALLAPDGTAVDEHVAADARVLALAFTPDGRRLACGTAAREVQLWDVATQRARALGGFSRPVRELAWSADGCWLIGAGGTMVLAWGFVDGPADLEPDHIAGLRAHTGLVRLAAFQPRGPFLATAGRDGLAVLWRLPAEHALAARGLGAPVAAAAWAPDGRRLALGTGDGRIVVLRLAT